MKVLFIHDFTVEQWLGGAQLEINWFMEIGRRKGHECKLITPENYSRDEVASAGLVIFNNVSRFQVEELNWISKQKPFITWTHDYTLAHWTLKISTAEKAECALNLLKNSLCNIFLSPLHAHEYQRLVNLEDATNLIMASPINVDLFQDLKLERDIDFLFAGRLSPPKGVLNVLVTAAANPNKNFYFAGSGPLQEIMREKASSNCKILGEVPYAKMPELYSRAKFFIYLPEWADPFAQVAVQAKLCNCNLIINQNVGAASYDWFFYENEKIRQLLRKVPFKGWEKIHEIYNLNRPPDTL